MKTPPRAEVPRKISPVRRSRATLRRELAHRQDIDRPALQTQQPPGAAHLDDSVEPFDADAQPRGHRTGRRSPPMNRGKARQSTRPGRPPSRRRNRPRATGKSGPAATSSRDATAHLVYVMNRTYVRRIRRPADGTRTNRCLCAQGAVTRPANWLNQAVCGASYLQRELHGTLCFGPGTAMRGSLAPGELGPRCAARLIVQKRRCPPRARGASAPLTLSAGRAPRARSAESRRV